MTMTMISGEASRLVWNFCFFCDYILAMFHMMKSVLQPVNIGIYSVVSSTLISKYFCLLLVSLTVHITHSITDIAHYL